VSTRPRNKKKDNLLVSATEAIFTNLHAIAGRFAVKATHKSKGLLSGDDRGHRRLLTRFDAELFFDVFYSSHEVFKFLAVYDVFHVAFDGI